MEQVSEGMLSFLLTLMHSLQWCAGVIVMGISAYFINKFERGQHLTFDIIISTISVVFLIPGLFVGFFKALAYITLPLDIAYSYLYLTGFIFAAEDYNWQSCTVNSPDGGQCSKKHAMEAFLFVGFGTSLICALVEGFRIWQRKGNNVPVEVPETRQRQRV